MFIRTFTGRRNLSDDNLKDLHTCSYICVGLSNLTKYDCTQRLSNLFPNNVAVTLENSRKCRQNQLVNPKPQLWIYTPII